MKRTASFTPANKRDVREFRGHVPLKPARARVYSHGAGNGEGGRCMRRVAFLGKVDTIEKSANARRYSSESTGGQTEDGPRIATSERDGWAAGGRSG
jgi:hypothetical protein